MNPKKIMIMGWLAIGLLTSPAGMAQNQGFSQQGQASYIGSAFHGRPTASGETFDSGEHTAAHRELPFGTLLKVTNLANQTSVIVRIVDRGPFRSQRIIDLSQAAFAKLAPLRQGVLRVKIEIYLPSKPRKEALAQLDLDGLVHLPPSAQMALIAAQ